MSYPKAFMDELRARLTLSDVIGRKVKVTRAGREFKACCPFHKEKSPSFTINDEKNFYHCFGCGAHGDAIAFVMNHDNLPFMEAVEYLASQAGIQVPKLSTSDIKKYEKATVLYEILEETAKFFESHLASKKALDYLKSRDLKSDIIKQFRLGYSPENSNLLLTHLKKNNFQVPDMIEAGVMKKSTRPGEGPYSFFRGRVMFPVCDLKGRVVAFGGRVMPEAFGGQAPGDNPPPKYINSADTDLFHKGQMVYAHNFARKNITPEHPVIVVEGYMDVIALHDAGFTTAVAPLGTALTETQVLELWKFAPEGAKTPVLCFDGDTAGRRAASRSLERLLPILRPDHSVRFAFLQDGYDPDDLIRKEGKSAMKKVLDDAVSLSEMLWLEATQGKDFSTPESRAGLKTSLEKRVALITDSDVQRFYLQDVRDRVSNAFKSQTGGGGGGNAAQRFQPSQFKKKPVEKNLHTAYRPSFDAPKIKPLKQSGDLRERVLVATIISYPELFSEFGENLGMFPIGDAELDSLRQSLIHILGNNADLGGEELKTELHAQGFEKIISAIFDKTLYLHAGFAKSGQSLETAREGWLDTWQRGLVTRKTGE